MRGRVTTGRVRRHRSRGWLLAVPALLWLLLFYGIPLVNQLNVSLMDGDAARGYEGAWAFSTYWDALVDYRAQFLRSIAFAAAATLIDFALAFPFAYFLAFKARRSKGVLLALAVLPFFVSYVLRTVAWQQILADNGWVVETLRAVGLVADDGRVLATNAAVIAGIAYNFLPFMLLPLYVALTKIDRRLIEAATDLHASRATAFRTVTLPLALPGIFAGTLLCFIPACGDYVNAALLGTPKQYMIGNVIQSKFLNVLDYPTAAALSFILMLFILLGIALYTRLLGARTLTEAAV